MLPSNDKNTAAPTVPSGEAAALYGPLPEKARQLLAAFAEAFDRCPTRFSSFLAGETDFLARVAAAAAPLPTDGTPYSRNLIYSGAVGEAMVAHWPAGSICWPHDHGGAWGLVTVLRGKVYELDFTLDGALLPSGEEKAYAAGSAIPVAPGGIHRMRAEPDSITLHLYSPCIREMKVYDQRSGFIYTVADECGAWIPQDPKLIVRHESFDRHPLHHPVP